MSIANKDDKLVSIRANFGMWGIGAYWTLVELVAEQLEEKSEKAQATLVVSELVSLFGCKRNKLETFLEHSSNISLINFTLSDKILQLDIPKLLDFADNYIKYDGKSLKSLQRQSKVSSKHRIDSDKDIDKKENKDIVAITFLDEKVEASWQEWIVYRKQLGKPLTDLSKKKQVNFLKTQPDIIACINQSIERGWIGLFEVQKNGTAKTNRGQHPKRPDFTQEDLDRYCS